ncbi:MAG TPA: DciA family protein [Marmoricola sp.]|nr:DciA family protein [Marmoricola sp.]
MSDESWPEDAQTQDAQTQAEEHDDRGLDLARSIARGLAGRTGPVRKRLRNTRRADPVSSSAHPDDRDPQTLGSTLGRLVDAQGWDTELRVHGVFTRWASVVGAEVAAHVTPESYADGRLLVRTDSTAWATQVKLLAANLVHRLNQDLGDGTVEVIDVLGPHTPRWTSGRFRVKGRGPRDTYG